MLETTLLVLSLSAPAFAEGARVVIVARRAQLVSGESGNSMVVWVRIKNTLPVPVDVVTVGVLYAGEDAALVTTGVAELYGGAGEGSDVGAITHDLRLALPARGRGEARFSLPIPSSRETQASAVFATHVLCYRVRRITAALALDLLRGTAAADACAAIAAFGLQQRQQSLRLASRERFAGRADLVSEFVAVVGREILHNISQDAAFAVIFASRALGVVGGVAAERALQTLAKSPHVHHLDTAVGVLRVARLASSPLESPLAHTLPPSVATAADVIGLALDDARTPASPIAKVPTTVVSPPETSASRGQNWTMLAAVGVLSLFLLIRWLDRRRGRPPGEKL